MLNSVLATILVWGTVMFALRVYLARLNATGWVPKAITAIGATFAVLSVIGVALYTGLQELLAENSILWSFS